MCVINLPLVVEVLPANFCLRRFAFGGRFCLRRFACEFLPANFCLRIFAFACGFCLRRWMRPPSLGLRWYKKVGRFVRPRCLACWPSVLFLQIAVQSRPACSVSSWSLSTRASSPMNWALARSSRAACAGQ